MSRDSIQLLIDGHYPDPDSGEPIGVPIRSIVIEDELAGHESDLVAQAGLAGCLAVVSDATTRMVMGERVEKALGGAARIEPVVLGEHPHADEQTAERLEAHSRHCDALVAVGSGTINDLCKYVAARLDVPYAVFATAPSMNGYTSANAAITIAGHKKSCPAVTPAGVFVDLGVLAGAPARMIRAGLGDSACRSTAQIDWLLSHYLLDTPYRSAPFALLAEDEPGLLAEPEALMAGELEAMRRLARTLILSGLGMTLCGSSQPASQGEHLISHYIDMMAPADRWETLHGEQVAVATLTMARLQGRFLDAENPPQLGPTNTTRDEVIQHFGAEVGEACWRELEPKRVTPANIERMNSRLAGRWDDIVRDCLDVAVGAQRLHAALAGAGAPVTPDELSLDPGFYDTAVRRARELRNRYTFLDLAGDAGTA